MRLLLVEDDDHVAAALCAVLARHGFDVEHVRTGKEALDALIPDSGDAGAAGDGGTHSGDSHGGGFHARGRKAGPQGGGAQGRVAHAGGRGRAPFSVVLLDLGLPDRDGFEICGRIRRVTGTPVIMVTARADVRSRIHGLNLGADDYIVKPYDTGELVARIHAVSRRTAADEASSGGAGTGPHPAERSADTPHAADRRPRIGPVEIDLPTRQVLVDGTVISLTRKEFDLLALLAQRPGVVFRREQIISEVWRTSWEGTGRTLEVHIASLRSKLRVPALIETVRGVGYRLVPPAPAG